MRLTVSRFLGLLRVASRTVAYLSIPYTSELEREVDAEAINRRTIVQGRFPTIFSRSPHG